MNSITVEALDAGDVETENVIQLSILPLTPGQESIAEKDVLATDLTDEACLVYINEDGMPTAAAPIPPEPLPQVESSQQASAEVKLELRTDLKNIMHAFGDTDEPLEASVDLMEAILRLELGGFLFLCEHHASSLTGSKTLCLKEAVLTLRREKCRLLRLFKYLVAKDQQMRFARLNQMSQSPSSMLDFVAEIRAVVDLIDTSGEILQLLSEETSQDCARTEKAARADRQHAQSTYPEYVAHAKARSVSFARKLTGFPEWLQQHFTSEFGLSHSFLEVLTFLAYDLVAHMVDLSFLVRREQQCSFNPISRVQDSRGANPETCVPFSTSPVKKRKDDDLDNVSEILVQASEMEAKRIKKVASSLGSTSILKQASCLTPEEIFEAYHRFQSGNNMAPSLSYKRRAERCKQLDICTWQLS